MAGVQSSTLPPNTDRTGLINAMETELANQAESADPSQSSDWQVWLIAPDEIEFWQGAKDRNHDRLQYKREAEGWKHSVLWP
jgi:pyridoxamine 5'-phosphate oxidase